MGSDHVAEEPSPGGKVELASIQVTGLEAMPLKVPGLNREGVLDGFGTKVEDRQNVF